MTQKQMIVKYIQDFGSISTYEAFIDLGIARLASRISDLKRDGLQIDKKIVTAKNRYGKTVHYARYKIGGKND